MDETLRRKINILMSNTVIENDGLPYEYKLNTGTTWPIKEESLEVSEEPDQWKLAHKQAETLVKLYQQLSSPEQIDLLAIMHHYFTSNYKTAIVLTAVLVYVHTDNSDQLADSLIEGFTSEDDEGFVSAAEATSLTIRYKSNLFSELTIEKLYTWVEDYESGSSPVGKRASTYSTFFRDIDPILGALRRRCNIVLTRSFTRQVDSAFNPELNIDEKRLVESIELVGFPLDLVESLRHIDELLAVANKPMKYRDCMSAIRVFTERLYERIAKELDENTKVDGKDSDVVAKFFLAKKLVSGDMAELIKAHRHFLSNDGAHRLKSRGEDARIAKNMTTEIGLYLMTRLREWQQDQAK